MIQHFLLPASLVPTFTASTSLTPPIPAFVAPLAPLSLVSTFMPAIHTSFTPLASTTPAAPVCTPLHLVGRMNASLERLQFTVELLHLRVKVNLHVLHLVIHVLDVAVRI